jgi:hypothetical protein
MIEYPVIVVYLALSSDVAKKRESKFGGFFLEMVRSECSYPYKLSILQFRYLISTVSGKVGKALKIAGKLQKFPFKRI